jgi:arylsulfatase A-like enzyme
MTNRTNILLITADQMRADAMGCAGHPLVRTPNLDRLAGQGAIFRRHYSQCPPCGPSRTALLTGMYLMNHRSVQNGTPLDAGFTNLALEVRALGYEPWLIGYTDTTMDPRVVHPNDPRLKRYEELLPGIMQYAPGSEWGTFDTDWRRWLRERGHDVPMQGYGAYAQADVDPAEARRRGPAWAPTRVGAEESDTAYTADRALRFLRQFAGTGWFLHLSFLRPHPPWVAPAPYNEMYRPEDVPEARCLGSRQQELAFHPFMPWHLERGKEIAAYGIDDHPNESLPWRQARATYFGLITELDHHIGRVLDALEQSGEAERTLVIFTSDHGEQLGDHWAHGKETPFEPSVHVPLIIRAPAGQGRAGVVHDAFTEQIDLMPTIIDMAGGTPPLQCDGLSLAPLLGGAVPAGWRSHAFTEYDFRDVANPDRERRFGLKLDECCMAAVRDERWKYVHFAGLPPMLFDLQEDPGELTDLAGDPALAPVILDCAQRMLDWRLSLARRELTGLSLKDGERHEAALSRRIRRV